VSKPWFRSNRAVGHDTGHFGADVGLPSFDHRGGEPGVLIVDRHRSASKATGRAVVTTSSTATNRSATSRPAGTMM